MLPTDAQARKGIPMVTGLIDYFPDALAAVARLSMIANEQHNPGKPVRWDRSKSGDEADTLLRHLVERGTVDTDGQLHSVKVAWRALALLQKELEELHGLPLPRSAIRGYDENGVELPRERPSPKEVFDAAFATIKDGGL